jgi:NAD(P)-dependent dehydrogenase (short-subunit alcohol dehydrogenase family)
MNGKVVVLTGGTSGIGWVAAERLARAGARLVLVARDRARGESALAKLRELRPGGAHHIHYGDLSRIAEMKRLSAEIGADEPRVDVLINNAGALFNSRHVTEDGLERTFALNHVAYFALTHGLRARLEAAAPARVVNVASDAHRGARLDFRDLQSATGYRGLTAYGRSKLCNVLYTRELARRWAGSGITANSLHPGFVATRFGDESGGLLSYGVRFAKQLFAISPERGADTIVYLASSDEVAGITGGYFYKSRPATPSPEAQDDDDAHRLWQETARLIGLEPPADMG